MAREPRPGDWQTLGLEPGAPISTVRRAYLQRRALYAPDSLATYSLLEEHERQEVLARIEDAYERITGAPAPVAAPSARAEEEMPEPPAGPPPSYQDAPGAHLRHLRLGKSIPLHRVADEIKVRPTLLTKLEEEDYRHLPAAVYVRGFVLQYARLLGVPQPDAVANAYLSRMEAAAKDR